MAQEYKLYVEDPQDGKAVADASVQVCQHLSACASATDSPDEFYGEVKLHTHPSRSGGVYICGTLDRDPQSKWLDVEVPREDYEIPGAVAAVLHDSVDLNRTV